MFLNGARSQSLANPEGRFIFVPKPGEGKLFVASADGFMSADTTELARKETLTLQPWAMVQGRLVRNGKPITNEDVDLTWALAWSPERQPWLSLHGTRTDDKGRFALKNDPPGDLHLTTHISAGADHGWTSHIQRRFTVHPGEEFDLGNIDLSLPLQEQARR
jgi:hypothetical protein